MCGLAIKLWSSGREARALAYRAVLLLLWLWFGIETGSLLCSSDQLELRDPSDS